MRKELWFLLIQDKRISDILKEITLNEFIENTLRYSAKDYKFLSDIATQDYDIFERLDVQIEVDKTLISFIFSNEEISFEDKKFISKTVFSNFCLVNYARDFINFFDQELLDTCSYYSESVDLEFKGGKIVIKDKNPEENKDIKTSIFSMFSNIFAERKSLKYGAIALGMAIMPSQIVMEKQPKDVLLSKFEMIAKETNKIAANTSCHLQFNISGNSSNNVVSAEMEIDKYKIMIDVDRKNKEYYLHSSYMRYAKKCGLEKKEINDIVVGLNKILTEELNQIVDDYKVDHMEEAILANIPKSLRGKAENYVDTIVRASKFVGVDPYLMTAMGWTETHFKPRKSSANADGIMQIIPSTYKDLKVKHADKVEKFIAEIEEEGILVDTEMAENVLLGTLYLQYLVDRFEDERLGVLAYNMGPTNMRKLLAKNKNYGHNHQYYKHITSRMKQLKGKM